jgi:CRP-like cAMP-binding protein
MDEPQPLADDQEQQRLIARYGRRFSAGEVLFHDGTDADEAFLLQEGRVRLIKRVGGVERGLRVLRPGDLFGESALMQGASRNATAVAMDDVLALGFDKTTFQHVLFSRPEVGARLLQQLIRRLREAEDQIEIILLRDTQAKVVVALMNLAQQGARPHGVDGPIALSISPLELSTYVGLDVDTVRRNVRELRNGGYVKIEHERVQVLDLQALVELYGLLSIKDQIVGGDGRPRRG